jgi:hypothetical protein
MRTFARLGASKNVRLILPGQPDKELPPDRAAEAKILCGRHNNALSSLDGVGGLVFQAIHYGVSSKPSRPCLRVSGIDFERWLLKLACGVRTVVQERESPVEWLNVLFGSTDWPPKAGMYMHAALDRQEHADPGIQYATYNGQRGQSGAEVAFHGVRFTLDLLGLGHVHRESDIGSMKVFRPSGVWFDRAGSTSFYLDFQWGEHPAGVDSIAINVVRGITTGETSYGA